MMPVKNSPFIINLYKPKDITSYDVIRRWKPKLRQYGKIGHFGTLDPFASGVLMLGVGGGQKLNEYIHECLPKTYLAQGILGKQTDTGDLTSELTQVDDSDYLKQTIASFSKEFIEQILRDKFKGEYLQSPHKYSAAKFNGRALHEWARDGVEIKKDKVQRYIYELEVEKYEFPHLWIRYKVSSGTYIRTLFSECANALGTIGVLESLIREAVGGCQIDNAIKEEFWEQDSFEKLSIDKVLDLPSIIFAAKEATLYSNGVRLKSNRAQEISSQSEFNYYWVRNVDKEILGLASVIDNEVVSKVNFN